MMAVSKESDFHAVDEFSYGLTKALEIAAGTVLPY
jgi:hypothetical protein